MKRATEKKILPWFYLFFIFTIVWSNPLQASLKSKVFGSSTILQSRSTQLSVDGSSTQFNSLTFPSFIGLDDGAFYVLNPALIAGVENHLELDADWGTTASGCGFISKNEWTFGFCGNRRMNLSQGFQGLNYQPVKSFYGQSMALGPSHPFDLYLGLDWGLKMGLHVGHAFRYSQGFSAQAYRIDGGFDLLGLQLFSGSSIATHTKNSSLQMRQDLHDFDVGIKGHVEDLQLYILWNQRREYLHYLSNSPLSNRIKMATMGASEEFDFGSWKFLAQLGLVYGSLSDDLVESQKRWVLPLDLGVEKTLLGDFESASELNFLASLGYDLVNYAVKNSKYDLNRHWHMSFPRPRVGIEYIRGSLSTDLVVGWFVNPQSVAWTDSFKGVLGATQRIALLQSLRWNF